MNWYVEVLRKYAVFSGRSRRREYWLFTLFSSIIAAVLDYLDRFLSSPMIPISGFGTPPNALGPAAPGSTVIAIGLLGVLYSLALLVPSLAVSVRRLHDLGRSGWWLLIGLVPVIGIIVLTVFALQDSEPGENAYGPNPKGEG